MTFSILSLCSFAHLLIRCLAATPSFPLTLTQNGAIINASSPHNLTTLQINKLPTDPTLYEIPDSTQAVEFSHYSRTLPSKDVLACLLDAANLATKKMNAAGSTKALIDTDEIQTYSGIAHFIFYPGEDMTWGMFATTVRGMSDFVEKWEFVDFDISVGESGVAGVVGSGTLVYI